MEINNCNKKLKEGELEMKIMNLVQKLLNWSKKFI